MEDKFDLGTKLAEAIGLPTPPKFSEEIKMISSHLALQNASLGEKQSYPTSQDRLMEEYRRDALERRLAHLTDRRILEEEAWAVKAKEAWDARNAGEQAPPPASGAINQEENP
jgi:hypothetical protein